MLHQCSLPAHYRVQTRVEGNSEFTRKQVIVIFLVPDVSPNTGHSREGGIALGLDQMEVSGVSASGETAGIHQFDRHFRQLQKYFIPVILIEVYEEETK